jgi:arylsulfatase
LVQVPGHIIDIMPTLAEVAGAKYPVERNGVKVQPMEGRSLLSAFANQPINRPAPLFFEHEGSRAVREGKWKLVSLYGDAWELYDLEADPTEMNNLIATQSARPQELIQKWEAWAKRCHVEVERGQLQRVSTSPSSEDKQKTTPATPQIANRPLRIRCEVQPEARAGVILAQGGRQCGYALHLEEGRPVFSVRITGQLFSVQAAEAPAGRFSLEAKLERDGTMRLAVNGREAASGKASGLIPTQPQDDLSIGEDTRTAVGNYTTPNPLVGKVENVRIVPE